MQLPQSYKSSIINLFFAISVFFVQPLFVKSITQKHPLNALNIPLGIVLLSIIILEFWATRRKFKELHENYSTANNPFVLWLVHLIGSALILMYGLDAMLGQNFSHRFPLVSAIFMGSIVIKELVLLGIMSRSNSERSQTNIYSKPDHKTQSQYSWATDLVIFIYSIILHGIIWGSIEATKATTLAHPIPGDATAAVMIFLLNAFSLAFLFMISYSSSRITIIYEDFLRVSEQTEDKKGILLLIGSYLLVTVTAVFQVMR